MDDNNLLQVGDVFEMEAEYKVRTYMPQTDPDEEWLLTDVIVGNVQHLYGEFVVVETRMWGGGTNRPHPDDPDGHQVLCEKKNTRAIKVTFYQTGRFHNLNKNIVPTGKVSIAWVLGKEPA